MNKIGHKSTTIRAAQLSDAEQITACVTAAYQQYIPIIGKAPGPMLDDYSQIIAQHTVSVIEEKGSIVGVVVLMEKEDGMLLDNVAVDPDYQGQGLGRQLIEWAHAEVHRRGFDQISLYTHEKMTQNIHIYQKLGYLESERRREYGYDRVYMKKYLKNH